MGLFSKKETDEEIVKRLAGCAGGIIQMLKEVFRSPQGINIQMSLLFASGLAGYACHQAVKKTTGAFTVARTKDEKNYYFGDDLNKFLLENKTSVFSFCAAVTGMSQEDVVGIVSHITASIGTEQCSIWNMQPESVYTQIKSCWTGIYDNMTAKFCKTPEEWPILYGIVLQNIILEAIKVAPKEEVGKMAMECAIMISKMDEDSL